MTIAAAIAYGGDEVQIINRVNSERDTNIISQKQGETNFDFEYREDILKGCQRALHIDQRSALNVVVLFSEISISRNEVPPLIVESMVVDVFEPGGGNHTLAKLTRDGPVRDPWRLFSTGKGVAVMRFSNAPSRVSIKAFVQKFFDNTSDVQVVCRIVFDERALDEE